MDKHIVCREAQLALATKSKSFAKSVEVSFTDRLSISWKPGFNVRFIEVKGFAHKGKWLTIQTVLTRELETMADAVVTKYLVAATWQVFFEKTGYDDAETKDGGPAEGATGQAAGETPHSPRA